VESGTVEVVENSRITLRFIRATGMLGELLSLYEQRQIHRECSVRQSRPGKFDRIKFEQPLAGPQGETSVE
jgi:hypothetical protein